VRVALSAWGVWLRTSANPGHPFRARVPGRLIRPPHNVTQVTGLMHAGFL
jgi:hypothetical protein